MLSRSTPFRAGQLLVVLATLPLSPVSAQPIVVGDAQLAQDPRGLARITGVVDDGTSTVSNVRVTVFNQDLTTFREARTDGLGRYLIKGLTPGTYRFGVAARGFQYEEHPLTIANGDTVVVRDESVDPETEEGIWDVVGSTLPEFLDATDIAVMRSDGKIFYCHDTVDPILFDPVTGDKTFPEPSSASQGCMNGTLLADGRIIMVGGQDGDNFRDAIPWVKTYDTPSDSWTWLPDMQHDVGRWYPGLTRLADGSLLVIGGGTWPSAARTDTCERFDLATETWSYTGSMLNPSEFTPSALLYTGEVLITWSPPQLYNPTSETWRATGDFVQSNRWWPGHSDHSIIVLSDGRVLALGIGGRAVGNTVMGEIYDPATESWSLTSNPDLVRFQCEVIALPDGRILVAGGETEDPNPPVADKLGVVNWTDMYDPDYDTWRRVAEWSTFREYHAVTLLVPDGRVLTTGGTNIKFTGGQLSADIEAYTPPYLLRGVRPQITSVSSTVLARGTEATLNIFPNTRLTSIVLMGIQSHTHWVECGVPRRLELSVSQEGSRASVTLPTNENVLPLGYYMMFAMVDDIPSVARVVQVVP